MPFIYVDRRKADKNKSAPNREKLLKRIRSYIKNSNPQSVGSGGVANVYGAGRAQNNPVKITSSALEEPWFAYARGGDTLMVLPGNTTYDRGDEIPFDGEGEGAGSGGSPGDGGEDEFVVNVAANEFLDLFFEDCELPNLDDEKTTEKAEKAMVHAGFSTQGNPAQLSIIRTYKAAIGRRRALATPYLRELQRLEAEMKDLLENMAENAEDDVIVAEISAQMDVIEKAIVLIKRKIAAVSGFDKVDLRFHKKEAQPLKQVDAVLIMVMDISGSMGQFHKTVARRWFALLYAFIKRRYENTDLVFLAHTDEVFELSEGDFFSTRMNGGTMVSPAIKKINEIIDARYDPTQTNIYVSHASDGDNWESDGEVGKEMLGAGGLMSKIQYFSYAEVYDATNAWSAKSTNTNLWDAYDKVHDAKPTKFSMAVLENPDDCYSIFKKIFKKK